MGLLASLLFVSGMSAGAVELENNWVRYSVTADASAAALTATADGANLLAGSGGFPLCTIQKGGITWESSSLTAENGVWHIGFGDAGVALDLGVESFDGYFTFEVVSVTGEAVDRLTFLYLPVEKPGDGAVLATTALALNLQTQVPELPGTMGVLQAACYPRFGLAGAKVALIAVPPAMLRATLQRVMLATDALPHSPLGGPWALDAAINRGSYLIDTGGEVGEATVGAWIALAKNLGMKQVDFHTGKSLRFGDLSPNPANYPNGLDGVKAVVDQLHAAGLAAGLHTYAFFVAKDTPWVTPVPDQRLAAAAEYTLGSDLDTMADEVPVGESTAGVSTVTGFQVRNSVTLRIDDELVVFTGVKMQSPFGFTGCQRGAWGTAPAPHAEGARVSRLKECFGLFVPDGDSTLFTEVAAHTAEVYNRCGFDMIYLDALDGSDILAGGENGWHYAAKFVFELNARLERPALFEMSTMSHHLWMLRSRMGAWDVPARGAQRLADIHALANEAAARAFMPVNLGWSGIFDWNPVQPERTYADDVEHLCARALASDASLSLLVGFTPGAWDRSANVRRLGGIIQRYETLRLEHGLPGEVLARLRESREPFVAASDGDGAWHAAPRHRESHAVTDSESVQWTFHNPFPAQPPRIRIEGLAGLAPYGSDGAVALSAGSGVRSFGPAQTADGVSLDVAAGASPPGESDSSISLVARNDGAPSHTAWAGIGKTFSPPRNLSGRGLGLWVHGDGSGAVLNVQLESTEAAARGRAEHYVDLDFTGWRYLELVEPESARLGMFGWPYSKRQADWGGDVPFLDVLRDYILWVDYSQIEHLNLWLNNIPSGEQVQCLVGPIQALPVQAITCDAIAFEINGAEAVLPAPLSSGEYIELDPDGATVVYGLQGERLREVALGALPQLRSGENAVRWSGTRPATTRIRVSLTVLGPARRTLVTGNVTPEELRQLLHAGNTGPGLRNDAAVDATLERLRPCETLRLDGESLRGK